MIKSVKKPVKSSSRRKVSENDYKHLIPTVIKLLKTAVGPHKGVNNQYIQRYVKSQKGIQLNSRTVQLIMHEIRTSGQVNCIMAGNDGYYKATSAVMAEGYERALMSRIKEQTELLSAFHNQCVVKFGSFGNKLKKSRLTQYIVRFKNHGKPQVQTALGAKNRNALLKILRERKDRISHIKVRKIGK